jgi:hypothetical protein
MVESQPSKLLVASSILVSRSKESTLYKRPANRLLHFTIYAAPRAFLADSSRGSAALTTSACTGSGSHLLCGCPSDRRALANSTPRSSSRVACVRRMSSEFAHSSPTVLSCGRKWSFQQLSCWIGVRTGSASIFLPLLRGTDVHAEAMETGRSRVALRRLCKRYTIKVTSGVDLPSCRLRALDGLA